MEHFKIRCKHCQREYTYCTYGNGPMWGTEAGCSKEYCAECQNAIDGVLGKIPVKYVRDFVEIKPALGLLDVLEGVKAESLKNRDGENMLHFPSFITPCVISECDSSEIYIHGGIVYKVEVYGEKPEDIRVYVLLEHDAATKLPTGNAWNVDEEDGYYRQRVIKPLKKTDIRVKVMDKPSGKLMYFDFGWPVDWDVVPMKPKKHVPGHELREYTITFYGRVVKGILFNGARENCRNACPDVKSSDIYDFMKYECSFVKYDDEDFETITNVRVI